MCVCWYSLSMFTTTTTTAVTLMTMSGDKYSRIIIFVFVRLARLNWLYIKLLLFNIYFFYFKYSKIRFLPSSSFFLCFLLIISYCICVSSSLFLLIFFICFWVIVSRTYDRELNENIHFFFLFLSLYVAMVSHLVFFVYRSGVEMNSFVVEFLILITDQPSSFRNKKKMKSNRFTWIGSHYSKCIIFCRCGSLHFSHLFCVREEKSTIQFNSPGHRFPSEKNEAKKKKREKNTLTLRTPWNAICDHRTMKDKINLPHTFFFRAEKIFDSFFGKKKKIIKRSNKSRAISPNFNVSVHKTSTNK